MTYQILNLSYDKHWNILTINGFFNPSSKKLLKVELYYDNQFVQKLDYGYRYNNKLIAYKDEVLINDMLDMNKIKVIYILEDGSKITDKYTRVDENLKKNHKQIKLIDKMKRLYKIVKYRYIVNKIYPKRVGIDNNILLFIHNLEFKERIEKLRCFELLDQELKKYGWNLIIIHHSLNKLETNIKTIEINDLKLSSFYKFKHRKLLKSFENEFYLSVEFLNLFKKSLNKNSMFCEAYDQVKDEFFKTKYLIDMFEPKITLNWHQWSSLQYMSTVYCKYLDISSFNVHEGALFDTLEIDKKGELAESWIFDDIKSFNNLKLEEDDIQKAEQLINKIKYKSLNRKPQNKDGLISDLLKPLKDKKIIFFAGVNDSQTGMLPTWYKHSDKHSKVFIDSYDALNFLKKLAYKNDWYILFKPHPNVPLQSSDFICDRVIYVKYANAIECIQESDITITLLSTLSYDVMIHNKPLVLLGNNLQSKSKSEYEVNSIYDVENTIEDALSKKNFDDKKNEFKSHVARLLKYYYFPYSEESTKYCHRDFNDMARYLIKNSKR